MLASSVQTTPQKGHLACALRFSEGTALGAEDNQHAAVVENDK
jgi:hypothetical protein